MRAAGQVLVDWFQGRGTNRDNYFTVTSYWLGELLIPWRFPERVQNGSIHINPVRAGSGLFDSMIAPNV
jgi:hypothetical protein